MNSFSAPLVKMYGKEGVSRLQILTFETLSQQHVQLLAEWNIPTEVFLEATKRSNRNGDSLLTHQVSVMHHVHTFLVATAKLWCLRPMLGTERGACTKDSVALIKAVRNAFAALEMFPSGPPKAEQAHHNTYFDKLFTTPMLIKGFDKEFETAMQPFKVAWQKNLADLCSVIQGTAPKWKDNRETLLSHKDIITSFLDNEKDIVPLGPKCQEIKDTIKILSRKSLGQERLGHLIDKKTLKQMNDIANYGVETLSFLFVIHYLFVDLPKLKNPDVMERTCNFVRKEIADREVTITEQMDIWLGEYAAGTRKVPDPFPRGAQQPAEPPEAQQAQQPAEAPETSQSSRGPAEEQPARPRAKRARLSAMLQES